MANNKVFSAKNINIEGSLEALEERANEQEENKLEVKKERKKPEVVYETMDLSGTIKIKTIGSLSSDDTTKRSYTLRKTTIKTLEDIKLHYFDCNVRFNDLVDDAITSYCKSVVKRAKEVEAMKKREAELIENS